MQDFILGISLFILVFGLLVIFHELGHYYMARLFNVGVKEFAVGFGQVIFSYKDKRNTLWNLRAIPFGGFVNILEEKSEEINGDTLSDKSYYQKMLIFIGGPLANIICAFIIAWGTIWQLGMHNTPSNKIYKFEQTIQSINPNAITLQAGDTITAVNGKPTQTWKDVQFALLGKQNALLTINRDINTYLIKMNATPIEEETKQTLLLKAINMVKKMLGYEVKTTKTTYKWNLHAYPSTLETHTILSAFYATCSFIYTNICEFFTLLTIIFTVGPSILSGPLGIGKSLFQAAGQGIETILWLSIKLSMSLGLFNLIPLPMLDGGQMFIATLEKIKRKSMSETFYKFWGIAGLSIIGSLMIYITLMDLLR